MKIRNADLHDLEVITDFNIRLALESENLILNPKVVLSGVKRGLSSPELCRYFLGEKDGIAVAQTMITFELTDWNDGIYWWIQSVYVIPEMRGRGVFRQIYHHIKSLAEQKGDTPKLKLYVDKSNMGALATYQKLGMSIDHYHLMEVSTTSNKPS